MALKFRICPLEASVAVSIFRKSEQYGTMTANLLAKQRYCDESNHKNRARGGHVIPRGLFFAVAGRRTHHPLMVMELFNSM